MEDARFLHRQANRCYQLAWQSFDLRVAQKLNLLGNEHTAKARELRLWRSRPEALHPGASTLSARWLCLRHLPPLGPPRFVRSLRGAAAVWPRAARAQQPARLPTMLRRPTSSLERYARYISGRDA